MMRILFTGVGRRIELLQAFRNAALVLNKELKIYGADMAGTAPALTFCDFTRRVVAMKNPGYFDNKLEVLGLNVDDVIITDELGGVQFRKPCNIAFRIMSTRWRLNPADIVYVGDNTMKDFQAPQQLGLKIRMGFTATVGKLELRG